MNIAEFLNKKYLELQYQQGKRITVEEFAKQFGVSQSLMTQWMNGKRNPGNKYKERIIELYGEDAIKAFGEDPDLYTIEKLWDHLTLEERQQLREEIEHTAAKNLQRVQEKRRARTSS